MQFSTLFQLYHGDQCTYPCFPGAPLTSIPNNILCKPPAAFPNNHFTIDNSERGMNLVTITCHQSSEKIIGRAEGSQVLYTID